MTSFFHSKFSFTRLDQSNRFNSFFFSAVDEHFDCLSLLITLEYRYLEEALSPLTALSRNSTTRFAALLYGTYGDFLRLEH